MVASLVCGIQKFIVLMAASLVWRHRFNGGIFLLLLLKFEFYVCSSNNEWVQRSTTTSNPPNGIRSGHSTGCGAFSLVRGKAGNEAYKDIKIAGTPPVVEFSGSGWMCPTAKLNRILIAAKPRLAPDKAPISAPRVAATFHDYIVLRRSSTFPMEPYLICEL